MRLHLIDGTYELFRAHYTKRPGHRAPDGSERKAVVGLVGSLLALLADPTERPTHVGVAFDRPIRSFRNDLFEGYKGDEGIEPELYAQFEPAEVATRALGLTVWRMVEFEADDAIATAAARWADHPGVEQVRICSPDKDFLQCVRGDRVVRVDRRRLKIATEATLREERGFGPETVPDFLALVGDTADGIPGLPGFGERTASALLASFGKLEGIPHDAATWPAGLRGGPALARTLGERWQDALLYRTLATLVRTVPLAESLDDLEVRGVPRSEFEAWCRSVGSETLRARVTRWATEA